MILIKNVLIIKLTYVGDSAPPTSQSCNLFIYLIIYRMVGHIKHLNYVILDISALYFSLALVEYKILKEII